MDVINEDGVGSKRLTASHQKSIRGPKPVERGSTLRVNALNSLNSRNSMSTMNTDIKGLKQKEENLMEKFWNEETKTGPKIRDIIEKIQKCKEDWERVP